MTGSGPVVLGIAIANALRRRGLEADFTILSSGHFAHLADRLGIDHAEIPIEEAEQLSLRAWPQSILFETLSSLAPDVLIVDQFWFMVHHFLGELPGRKIFLSRRIEDSTFSISLKDERITFRPADYDRALATEPFAGSVITDHIEPIIIRNRDEILPREQALDALDLHGSDKTCLFAINGKPGEFEEKKKMYSYLEENGYAMVYSSNFRGGLFPAVDYFAAFDLLVCGAGYNAFWEAIYFEKEAIFVPFPRRFENQRQRVADCEEYICKANGADQLVDIMVNL